MEINKTHNENCLDTMAKMEDTETKKEKLLDKIKKQGGEATLGDCLLLDMYNKKK